ncbi:MAG: VanZ family protein [Chloroflexi bacterium]|nr:VanZ family protein [Chloroflexota bacterium]
MTSEWRQPRTWAVALVLTACYAITDELHQGFVAGRYPSPVDVGIDTLGALIAIAIVLAITSREGRAPGR